MTGPVEHERGDVVRVTAERLRDGGDVVGDRSRQVDLVARARADRHPAHVHVGQPQQRTGRADGEHRHRAGAAARDDAATLERVDGEVERLAARADGRPRRQHVAVLGADHDGAADRQLRQPREHGDLRGLFGRVLVVAPEPARARQGGPFGRAREEGAGTDAERGVAHAVIMA